MDVAGEAVPCSLDDSLFIFFLKYALLVFNKQRIDFRILLEFSEYCCPKDFYTYSRAGRMDTDH